jgi:hypothetical protein
LLGGLQSEVSPGQKHKTLPEKIIKVKSTGGMAQVVEHLFCKCESLSLNPVLPKKNVLKLLCSMYVFMSVCVYTHSIAAFRITVVVCMVDYIYTVSINFVS